MQTPGTEPVGSGPDGGAPTGGLAPSSAYSSPLPLRGASCLPPALLPRVPACAPFILMVINKSPSTKAQCVESWGCTVPSLTPHLSLVRSRGSGNYQESVTEGDNRLWIIRSKAPLFPKHRPFLPESAGEGPGLCRVLGCGRAWGPTQTPLCPSRPQGGQDVASEGRGS